MNATEMEKFLGSFDFPVCESHPHETKEIICMEQTCEYYKKLLCTMCFYNHDINHRNYTIKSLITFIEHNEHCNRYEELVKTVEYYTGIDKVAEYISQKIDELNKMKNELLNIKKTIDDSVNVYFSDAENLKLKFTELFNNNNNKYNNKSNDEKREELVVKYLKNLHYNCATNKLQYVNYDYYKVLNELKIKYQERYNDIAKYLADDKKKLNDRLSCGSSLNSSASVSPSVSGGGNSNMPFSARSHFESKLATPLKPSVNQDFEQAAKNGMKQLNLNICNNCNSNISTVNNKEKDLVSESGKSINQMATLFGSKLKK